MRLRDYVKSGKPDYYEMIARKLLKGINFDHPREIDFYELCDQFGMIVKHSEQDNFSISSGRERNGLILLKTTRDEKKNRQLIAEEFSHLYLHQTSQLSISKNMINKAENQAFNLASNILLPTEWLMEMEVSPYRNEMRIIASDFAEEFDVLPEYVFDRLKLLNNNYKFNIDREDVFKDVIYEMPLFFIRPRIYVVLDSNTKFSLD